jgi:hypothetical protein
MTENDKSDAILQAMPWRCFHCDFITTDREEAEAHFGDRDDPTEFKPICKWWASMSDDERIATLQDIIKQLNAEQRENMSQRTAIEGLTYQVDGLVNSIKSYAPFRECSTIYQVFCVYDSMEGRALAAEAKLADHDPKESA